MATDHTLRRYRRLYAGLIRCYPSAFRRRFGEGMEQTFHDLCRERRSQGQGLLLFVLGTFAETTTKILEQRMALLMPSRRYLTGLVLTIAVLLSIPWLAMRLGADGVLWTAGDFVAMGILLFAAGLGFGVVAKRVGEGHRAATALMFVTTFLLIWVNLAVGIIGADDNPANELYLGVLLVGAVGVMLARWRPRNMARAMYATALAQLLVPFVAMAIWRPLLDPANEPGGLVRVLLVNACFALLFVAAARLFQGSPSTPAKG